MPEKLKIADVQDEVGVSEQIQVTVAPPMAAAPTNVPTPQEVVQSKKDYELAVDAFKAADSAYEELEKYITEGFAVRDIVTTCGNDQDKAAREWCTLWGRLSNYLEDRNAKRKAAVNALRQAVVLTESQWKGIDGKPVSLQYDKFTVTSHTKRSFHSQDLLQGAQRHGLLESLLALKGMDKDGKSYSLVEQQWVIDFDGVKNWLIGAGLNDVLQGAYDEVDGTPAVTGPKELAFLGETRKSS
jgi:hypothetical protein